MPNNRRYYGGNNSNGDDQRLGQMVSDAISKAGNEINWSQYDNDGDGYADACIVVYAGPGEAAGAAAETIWPAQWYLSASDYGNYVTRNNTKIDKFAVFCELYGSSDSGTSLDGIGTFCHEFSHCLGLPDFYPTDYSNHFGMGSWSVMHGGCDNNNGNRPCSYTAYERNFLGWMNLSTPTEGETYTIPTVDAGGQAFKITSNNSNEYYVIENIQKSGWNQYAPASGLQVTHVNYNATRWNNNSVNNYAAQGMTIIPADNSLKTIYSGGYYFTDESDQVGDLYPYNGNNQLTSTSTPAATLYNSSTNLNKPITNITKNSNNTVSFTYMGSQAPATPSPYIYVLTNTLTAGKEYLIVNANSVGSRYAMGHSNTTVASDAVTVKSDPTVAEAPYIESTDVDATSVWTAGSSGSLWTFKNGNYFVTLTDRNALTFTTSSTRNWTKGTNQLYNINRNNNYYLRYNNNNFSVSTTSANIYIYEKREVTLTGVPTIVSAEPTSTTAEITWTPGENNEDWNLRYREYVEGASSGQSTLWDLSLANYQTQIADFSVYDADGDGDVWGLVYSNEEQTDVCFASWSYDPDTQSDLTPDNWLFTPEVELGGTLKFKSALRLTGWPDKLGVYVLPTGDDSYYKLGDIVPDAVFPSFGEYEFDLSDFEGMGQIAFRHYESDGNVAILLDDIEVITAAVSGGQWIYVDSENSPYTITGLTPETTYEVQVQGVNNNAASDWTESTLFTTLSDVDIPIIVSATPTFTTSEIVWTPGEENEDWNLRYRSYVESTMETITWTFPVDGEGYVMIDGWNYIDNDEDGHDWGLMATDGDDNTDPTDACWYSQSYINDVGALTPDNWLVSPEVQLGGTFKFKAWRSQYPGEVLGVYVYQEGNEYLIQVGQDIQPTQTETEYEFDLSGFNGTGRVIIRHYNCTDGFYVFVDDITLTQPSGASQPEWIYVYSEESPYTITGLTPETTYEVQVQGVGDGGATSAWTASTLFTTLSLEEAVEATLAEIEGGGTVGITYTISDELVAVHADTDGEYGMLWCKDQGNASINPSSILVGQIDFMRDEALTGDTGQGNCDWDQSNWVVLKFPAAASANGIADLLNDAVGKKIKVGTVTGRYIDKSNYTIEVQPVDGAYVLTYNGTLDYTPNVYCVANFVESNLNIGGNTGAVGAHGVHYFFMNPKIQEVCEITYAMWDGEKFVTPDNTEIKGALNVDWSHNSDVGVPSLREGQTYRFKAIVTHPATRLNGLKGGGTPSDNFVVSPTNLTGEGNIVTAINGVYTESYREVVGVEYVNSLGVVSKTPFQGVNIVVTRYSDGSATSVKKVFK